MKMSLQRWVEYGWLRVEPSSREEIEDLLGLVSRALKDSRVDAISDDLRFQAAFSAMLNSANTALRASGFRTRVQTGHHQKIIESLEFTLQPEPGLVQKMRVFSKKRNATSYDAAGSVSEAELVQAIELAERLKQRVTDWLQSTHPELC
jgi:hypothetical protein